MVTKYTTTQAVQKANKENGKKAGRPQVISAAYRHREFQMLTESHAMEVVKMDNGSVKRTRLWCALNHLYKMGMKGNVEALKTYLNRVAGMPRQQVDIQADIRTLRIDL